jgi:hypothetical protein
MNYTSGPCQFPISLRYHLGLVILLPALFIVGMNPGYRRLWCPARFAISDPRMGSVSLRCNSLGIPIPLPPRFHEERIC